MATDDLQVRLCMQEIVKVDLEIKALLQDIKEYADCTEILEDINTDVRSKINKLKKKIEELETLGHEQEKEEYRQLVQKNVDSQRQRLNETLLSLKKAILLAQMKIDQIEREELLKGGTVVRKRSGKGKEAVAKAASGITESLVSLNKMMSERIALSQQTNVTLAKGSQTMKDTHEEMKDMSGHIKNAKNLITKYGRRQLTDRLLIILALIFFFGSVLYVVKKRLL